MAIVSPGVEVQIIDESQYASASINTVPFILMATAENKATPSGTSVATGTLASNANKTYLVTSQRELVNLFGNPFFYKTTTGNSIHGYELNEYGLMAAYSVLGATNRAYVMRVDVDLAELSASLTRPSGNPAEGTMWVDTDDSSYGVFVWNAVSNKFEDVQPSLFVSSSLGNVGDYSVVVGDQAMTVVYKNSDNEWVLLGSDKWKKSIPAFVSDATSVQTGVTADFNGITVTTISSSIADLVTIFNSATGMGDTGLTAKLVDGKFAIYISADSTSEFVDSAIGSSANTMVAVEGSGLLSDIGLDAGTYNDLTVYSSAHTSIPRWRSTDTSPRPTGSVWIKTTNVDGGLGLLVSRYNAVSGAFIEQDVIARANDWSATNALDASGGSNIAANTVYAQYDIQGYGTAVIKLFQRLGGDVTVSSVPSPAFVSGHSFTVKVSVPGSDELSDAYTVTLAGTDSDAFVQAWTQANIPNTSVNVTSTDVIEITHDRGGVMVVEQTDTAFNAFISDERVRNTIDYTADVDGTSEMIVSNWLPLEAEYSVSQPGVDPVDGARWYYPAVDEVDIMIQDGGNWLGYKNVNNDVRGFDLTVTNSDGPIIAANAPTAQNDGSSLEMGDLWLDTSDLENYPMLYRWEAVDSVDQWVPIDNSDQTSINGIVFADARWGTSGEIDPISDDIPSISDLLVSNYTDLDCPLATMYPEGTLLFNLRRSGYNVKEFRVDYFNSSDFSSGILPTQRDTWVTVSGLQDNGAPNMGRHAQRAMVVAAMKGAVDSSEELREEQRTFNLLSAPAYPELTVNMIALNNDRKNTGFIVGDSPMRLSNAGQDLVDWATNNNGLGLPYGDGLNFADEYTGVFYPAAQTNDLSGSTIVVPASHMILRTIIRSDEQSYQWFAPAGVRRGIVDNASGLGYIDAATGEFQQIAVREGVRDVLYTNNVNPITFIPGSGIVNYGNKTTLPGSALDRINVARLVSFIRQQLMVLSKPFLFEPNDEITRNEIKNVVDSMLNDLVAKRGVADYVVVCDKSNNTPLRIDRNELYVDIAIVPVKSVEFIYLPVRIKNTGEI